MGMIQSSSNNEDLSVIARLLARMDMPSTAAEGHVFSVG